MAYTCPKGHQSTDSDYCSECGALIGESKLSNTDPSQSFPVNNSGNTSTSNREICPDCGTPRTPGARFCEVCRHDFQNNKTGIAEAIVASQQPSATPVINQPADTPESKPASGSDNAASTSQGLKAISKNDLTFSEKLNVVISVDADRAASCDIETAIKPDAKERIFPLDLDENLVGRRSNGKGIYPEIEINDPGVSHRHLKFIKQPDGSFAVLELGSANGTELNAVQLEPGVNTAVKSGDELTIGIWTRLKIVSR